ncbi:MAG: GNAT family N-acetyltransferase [Clostridia bacterium]
MKIVLTRVNIEEKNILYRLLEYSLFEESLYDGNEMNNEGIFEYRYFDSYFTDKTRAAFFIKDESTDKLLGFVMINTYVQKKSEGHSIAEFMIIPKYRRKNIGKSVAIQCFNMYKGNWEVSPSLNSDSAYKFWKKVISEYTNNKYEFEDRIFFFNI